MTDKSSIPPDKQVNHLILLVGGNPLPNAVAAQLLAKPSATIWLLYSDGADGSPTTKKTADNLETFLRQRNSSWAIRQEPIPSADSLGIERRVKEIVAQNKINGCVGLHYTGGTKSMAVHTYRALEQVLANNHPHPVYSYLDPRLLALRIDGHSTESSQLFHINQIDEVRTKVEIRDIDVLANLHNYVPCRSGKETWGESDGVKALAETMVQIHISPKGYQAWGELRQQWRSVPQVQDFHLPDRAQFPALMPLIAAFDNLCGGSGKATPALVAKYLKLDKPNPTLRSCSKWLLGGWLELYTKESLSGLPSNLHIAYKGADLAYKSSNNLADKFQLDVVAIKGYQLFAISCIATTAKPQAKEHFFEVYVRARQLGGDESRIGLVCLVESSAELENEIKNTWDAEGKVKVFGRNELSQLTQKLADWFKQAG